MIVCARERARVREGSTCVCERQSDRQVFREVARRRQRRSACSRPCMESYRQTRGVRDSGRREEELHQRRTRGRLAGGEQLGDGGVTQLVVGKLPRVFGHLLAQRPRAQAQLALDWFEVEHLRLAGLQHQWLVAVENIRVCSILVLGQIDLQCPGVEFRVLGLGCGGSSERVGFSSLVDL